MTTKNKPVPKMKRVNNLYYPGDMDYRYCVSCFNLLERDDNEEDFCPHCGWTNNVPEVRMDDKRGLVETCYED